MSSAREQHVWGDERESSEDGIKRQLNYYEARLVDIDTAPPNSRHREGRAYVVRQIEECRDRLQRLRRQRQAAHRRSH